MNGICKDQEPNSALFFPCRALFLRVFFDEKHLMFWFQTLPRWYSMHWLNGDFLKKRFIWHHFLKNVIVLFHLLFLPFIVRGESFWRKAQTKRVFLNHRFKNGYSLSSREFKQCNHFRLTSTRCFGYYNVYSLVNPKNHLVAWYSKKLLVFLDFWKIHLKTFRRWNWTHVLISESQNLWPV